MLVNFSSLFNNSSAVSQFLDPVSRSSLSSVDASFLGPENLLNTFQCEYEVSYSNIASYFLFSADDEVVQAGYLEKFRSFVMVRHDGVNMWASPATFKSTCKLDVQFFPFDKQKCSLVFRSLTAGRSLLEILAKNIKSDDPDKGMITVLGGHLTDT